MSKEVVRVTQAWRTIFVYPAKNRQRILMVSGSIVAVVAVLDIVCVHTVVLGFLYVIPLVLAAGYLSRWQIVAISTLCAIWREWRSSLRSPHATSDASERQVASQAHRPTKRRTCAPSPAVRWRRQAHSLTLHRSPAAGMPLPPSPYRIRAGRTTKAPAIHFVGQA